MDAEERCAGGAECTVLDVVSKVAAWLLPPPTGF
jgi:hypothetical protein